MVRTSPWPTVLGTAALLALPVLAVAQTSGTGSQASPAPTAQSDRQSAPASQPNPASATSSQTGSATGETAQSQTPQTATGSTSTQADANAARQHLAEARQSLADMTALPQAQQLEGEARTQVSQLISQFNQLITTQADWRSPYDQVDATLTTLLSSSTSSGAPTSTTTGAVGTSGSASASGASTLDPAIRGKLEEFRTHLQAFYTSAGGDAAGSASSTASAEAESHIAAIERILDLAGAGSSASGSTGSTTGTPGGTNTSTTSGSSVTLTQQQIEQIKMHLQQLRSGIRK